MQSFNFVVVIRIFSPVESITWHTDCQINCELKFTNMSFTHYLIGVYFFLLLPFSGISQDLELPRLGTFEVDKKSIPEMHDIWKQPDYGRLNQKLKLPKVNSKNYRTPVDMVNVVASLESGKQAGRNQELIDNIRISYGSYRKDGEKSSFRVNSSFHGEREQTEQRFNMPFGACIHGNTQRYCNICSPRAGFRNAAFGPFIHPAARSFYYP